MDFINKLEAMVGGWAKNVPHLPIAGQKWLAVNVWWIVLIIAILSGISVLFGLSSIFTLMSLIGTTANSYYVNQAITGYAVSTAAVSLLFLAAEAVLMGLAVKPLKDIQKKGWVLLFLVLLVQAIAIVVGALLTGSMGGFIVGVIFGAICLAIEAYFLFEIRGEFAHVTKHSTKNAAKKA